MPIFDSKPFRSSSSGSGATLQEKLALFYRRKLSSHPFLLFGLPFISLMVASSFLLTPATALRYERHDARHKALSQNEAMEIGIKRTDGDGLSYNPRRRVVTKGGTSERDEYYRLMAKDLDTWEQRRVERWKGEPDGRM